MSGKVFQLLAENAALNSLGIDENCIFTDWSADTPPRDGIFVIMRWGPEQYVSAVRTGPRDLDVWVHQPQEFGTDFTIIDRITRSIRRALEEANFSSVELIGDDDIEFVQADYKGHGGNVNDPGFKTFTKRSSYTVLLRTMV